MQPYSVFFVPLTPVAVFHHDWLASFLDVLVEQDEVCFATTSVKFPGVKVVFGHSSHIIFDLCLAICGVFAMVTANAVVSVCV
jgi:hypothetical protein